MRTHFPQTGWAWCHLGGLCPGAAISLGVGVGGVPAPKTRLPLVGQGGSGRKAVQGNAPSWTGRTGLGWQAPANGEEARSSAWVSFPKPVAPRGWGIPPKGRDPHSTIGGGLGRNSDGLHAVTPKWYPFYLSVPSPAKWV